jgi:hypothetical protein
VGKATTYLALRHTLTEIQAHSPTGTQTHALFLGRSLCLRLSRFVFCSRLLTRARTFFVDLPLLMVDEYTPSILTMYRFLYFSEMVTDTASVPVTLSRIVTPLQHHANALSAVVLTLSSTQNRTRVSTPTHRYRCNAQTRRNDEAERPCAGCTCLKRVCTYG